ncbi:MAG: ABC transporter substrate-binding protein [Acidimicrobiales bacterium]|jgi:ABC-type branched-subunit amino acid transport system substrate-binding protein
MPLRNKKFLAAGLTCLVLLISAGCSSNSSTGTTTTTGSSTGGTKTFTIGLITDATGPAASEAATSVQGVEAAVGVAASEGYKIKYIVADTGTNPSQVLSGAQKLVEQDHVFAVIGVSALLFEATPYLTTNGIPVVGGAFDSSEWLLPKSYNMFSVIGNQDFTKVYTTTGLFLKSQGVTNLGSIGYSVSPSSAAAARAASVSAGAQGIKTGYLNDSFPFGSTNVAPVALAMKSAGINALVAQTEPSTVFALATALDQQGVKLKATLLATGGGGDLIAAGPAAIQAAQGDDFLSDFEPPEMHTAATQALQNALAKYADVHTDPTFAEYIGYLSVLGLVQGLQGAGANPTQASTIKALSHITDYDAEGLWGGHQTVDWSVRPQGPKECFWITKLKGQTFNLISGSDPVCGMVIPGKRV